MEIELTGTKFKKWSTNVQISNKPFA